MKVLFVNGSSHKNGTTMQAVKEMQKVFEAQNIETEVIQLGNKPIQDCIQCGYCYTHAKCVFNDDVNEFIEKAKEEYSHSLIASSMRQEVLKKILLSLSRGHLLL